MIVETTGDLWILNMMKSKLKVLNQWVLHRIKLINQSNQTQSDINALRMNPVLTSWWVPRWCASGRTPGTRRAGGCSADAQCHGSGPCFRHRAARARGEACPCGRGPWRTACSNRSGTSAPAAPCSERWRNRRCRLWVTRQSVVAVAQWWEQ